MKSLSSKAGHFAAAIIGLTLALPTRPMKAQHVIPTAVFTDPPRDAGSPARMQVLHIPSAGVRINGVAYVAAGAVRHPTFVFFHGLPGNEKHLDLAQAVRRAGWNAITVNYRGSWGSPGQFKFANTLADADAVLDFLRDSTNARSLGIDIRRVVIAGHSMGGWVAAHTASRHAELAGAIMISPADLGRMGATPRVPLAEFMATEMESLVGTTAENMAEELIANRTGWALNSAAIGLAKSPLLVLISDDAFKQDSATLVASVRALGNRHVTAIYRSTDHSWSDSRIALQSAVLEWLAQLPPTG
jgi:pimeloyl-ACP methyl ester carboxylesterase